MMMMMMMISLRTTQSVSSYFGIAVTVTLCSCISFAPLSALKGRGSWTDTLLSCCSSLWHPSKPFPPYPTRYSFLLCSDSPKRVQAATKMKLQFQEPVRCCIFVFCLSYCLLGFWKAFPRRQDPYKETNFTTSSTVTSAARPQESRGPRSTLLTRLFAFDGGERKKVWTIADDRQAAPANQGRAPA